MQINKTPQIITTPAGYQYSEPNFSEKEHFAIEISYKDMYDTILDGIWCESTLESLTPPTFSGLAENLIHLLIDAYADMEHSDETNPPMLQIVPDIDEKMFQFDMPFELAYNGLMECLRTISAVKLITQRRQEDTANELMNALILIR